MAGRSRQLLWYVAALSDVDVRWAYRSVAWLSLGVMIATLSHRTHTLSGTLDSILFTVCWPASKNIEDAKETDVKHAHREQ